MTKPTPEELDMLLTSLNAEWKRLREIIDRSPGPLDDERAREAEPVVEAIDDGMRKLKGLAERAKGTP